MIETYEFGHTGDNTDQGLFAHFRLEEHCLNTATSLTLLFSHDEIRQSLS